MSSNFSPHSLKFQWRNVRHSPQDGRPCPPVYLLAALRKNYWTYLCENFTTDVPVDMEELVKFCKSLCVHIRVYKFCERLRDRHCFSSLAPISGKADRLSSMFSRHHYRFLFYPSRAHFFLFYWLSFLWQVCVVLTSVCDKCCIDDDNDDDDGQHDARSAVTFPFRLCFPLASTKLCCLESVLTTCPELLCEVEPVSSWLLVHCPNHLLTKANNNMHSWALLSATYVKKLCCYIFAISLSNRIPLKSPTT